MSLKPIPAALAMSELKPHLSLLEPKATSASWIVTFHFSLYSGSA